MGTAHTRTEREQLGIALGLFLRPDQPPHAARLLELAEALRVARAELHDPDAIRALDAAIGLLWDANGLETRALGSLAPRARKRVLATALAHEELGRDDRSADVSLVLSVCQAFEAGGRALRDWRRGVQRRVVSPTDRARIPEDRTEAIAVARSFLPAGFRLTAAQIEAGVVTWARERGRQGERTRFDVVADVMPTGRRMTASTVKKRWEELTARQLRQAIAAERKRAKP